MVDLVYRCHYCTYTYKEKDLVQIHERDCSFNPSLKSCYSCKYHGQIEYTQFGYQCENNNVNNYLDVEDGLIKCEFWEIDE